MIKPRDPASPAEPDPNRQEELDDTSARLQQELTAVREELARVTRERDELRAQLKRVDSVQTSTIALAENDPPAPPPPDVPSLDDLIAALGDLPENPRPEEDHPRQRVPSNDDPAESIEMIAPELVFPEEFSATAKIATAPTHTSRMLVLLDAERPIKYPLFKESMTIGRADSADIQITNGYLSRLHARLVTTSDGVMIEDMESKNGIRVNTKATEREALRHGDVVEIGKLRFRYLETPQAAE